MVDITYAFLALVIVLDIAISVWNAYAAGLTLTLLRGQPGNRFAKASAVAALGLGFAGMAYSTLIVLSFVALFVGFIGVIDVLFLISFDFLVFAAMIIGFGLVVTAQSVAIAYRQRNFGAIAVAAWNVFAEVWDIAIYAEGFRDASKVVGSEKGRVNLYAIVAAAVGVAFIITFAAYRHGVRKAEDAIESSPGQPGLPDGRLDQRRTGKAHPLRTVLAAGAVTVAVVIGIIVVAPYVTPKTTVSVSEIDVWAPTNVCGLGTNLVYYSGFTDHVGASDSFRLEIRNFNASACTVQTVSTNTSGFSLQGVGVPVTVPGMARENLSLTIVLPNSPYSGTVNLIYG